jgi:cyclin-dependent kinase
VTSFPDYKPTFPQWARDWDSPLIATLDDFGLELLEGLLAYDPAQRVSAKQACQHGYFTGMAPMIGGNGYGYSGAQSNGFH